MLQETRFQWAEEDLTLPEGVDQLGLSEPADGKESVMYYGTTSAEAAAILASGFLQSKDGMLGFSRDLEKASRYPIDHPESDKVVIKVSVNMGGEIAVDYQEKTWQEDCVWDPDQSSVRVIGSIKPRPVKYPVPPPCVVM